MERRYISDIGLAAYMKVVKGFSYAELPRIDGSNGSKKFMFAFEIDEKTLNVCHSEYLNSVFRSFDQEIRTLKKMMHGGE